MRVGLDAGLGKLGVKLTMEDPLLAAAQRRFDQAEIYRFHSVSDPISFEANRLKETIHRESSGVALRVIADGQVGFSSTTNPEDEEQLVDRVAAVAPYGDQARFTFSSPAGVPEVPVFDRKVTDLSFDEMAHTGQTMIDRLRSKWPELACEASIGKSRAEVKVVNTAGVNLSFEQTVYYLWVSGTLIRGTDMLHVGDAFSSSRVVDVGDRLIASVIQQLDSAKDLAVPPLGEVPIMFTPKGFASCLLRPLLAGFSGKKIADASSPLTRKMGDRIVSERMTIRDNPLIPFATGSRPFDDEGVPSETITLIEHGHLASFLFDLRTAGLTGTRSTASAHRGLSAPPSPDVSVIDVEPGDCSLDDMLSGIKAGLIVEQVLGAGQGNELGGDFKVNVLLGYRVENGRIVGRVKDTVISGNVYRVLNSVDKISMDREWVLGSMRVPAITCRGIQVAGK